jgi:hypothetical protein
MTRSWLDEEKSTRKYRLKNGLNLVVQNEYQIVICPHCQEQQYCRLTHIWHFDKQNQCKPEYHTNYHSELSKLKELLITYVDGIGIIETQINGKWALMKGDQIISNVES